MLLRGAVRRPHILFRRASHLCPPDAAPKQTSPRCRSNSPEARRRKLGDRGLAGGLPLPTYPSGFTCKEKLSQPSGYIYNNWYSTFCTWTIEVPYGRVELRFDYLYMTTSGGACINNYVTVYDGHPRNSVVLGRFCQYTSQKYFSSHNVMTLEFVNNDFNGRFRAKYTSSSLSTQAPSTTTTAAPSTTTTAAPTTTSITGEPCYHILTEPSGYINSYSYLCNWEIQVPYGTIGLYFSSVNMNTNGGVCNSEYVTIHNGHYWDSWNVLGKICQNTGQVFYSSSNVMTLKFVSPDYSGIFEAWYSSSSLSTTASPTTSITGAPCYYTLTEPSGYITSYSYLCNWEIEVPYGTIELHFSSVKMNTNGGVCNSEYVTIYDGHSWESSSVLGVICQNTDHVFYSSSNVMFLKFVSPDFSGFFQAWYSSSSLPPTGKQHNSNRCGGILTELDGTISLDSAISSESDTCIWYISVSNNYRIDLTFRTFIRRKPQSCYSSSLSIYDGTPRGSTLLGDLCRTNSRRFVSSSNSISIVYSRADREAGLEFSALYYSTFTNNRNVSLSCYSDYMEVRVSLRYLESMDFSSDNIYLNDPYCRPQVVSDWLEFHIPYDRCLTVKQAENDTISYTNRLFTNSDDTIITYRKKIGLTLKCRLYQNTVVEGMYSADDFIKNEVIQYGLYSATLTFFHSSDFTHPVSQYPYYVNLNQHLYLQATLHVSDPGLVVFVETCVASPDKSDFSRNCYDIMRNGCGKALGFKTFSSPSKTKYRFGFNAFSFLKNHSNVYIQCKLVVCMKGSANNRCSQGCIRRRKRSADPRQHEEVHMVVGPVQLQPE